MQLICKKIEKCMRKKNNMHFKANNLTKQRWRKLLLLCMLLLQMLVIGGFWLLQVSNYNAALSEDLIILPVQPNSVHFIKQKSKILNNLHKELRKTRINNVNAFEKDFKQISVNHTFWCFREGTEWQLSVDECVCKAQWHGEDCAKPEVVWRALMTSRESFNKLNAEAAKVPIKIIYIIEGNFLNLLLLELQIEAVADVVDHFIFNYTNTAKLEVIEKHLRQIFHKRNSTNYTLLLCNQQQVDCLHKFPLKMNDICVYSNDHTILATPALKFIKYYANKLFMPQWRFRLKHNVYGFYWQHPQQTQVQSYLGSCNVQLQQQYLLIGDLNHFGGWFCEFCDQPEEIITTLLLPSNNITSKIASNLWQNSKTGQINAEHLEQLISQGLYIDGKTQLYKVRRYSDSYYAPEIALNNSFGKYSYLLQNMYESLDDELLDDNYAK